MADYLPLIARAVAGLERNTKEQRRALYKRARTALVMQLRGVVPALDESEIRRERSALEDAIRKVERDAALEVRRASRESWPQEPLSRQDFLVELQKEFARLQKEASEVRQPHQEDLSGSRIPRCLSLQGSG